MIYPVSFSCFDTSWSIKISEVIELNNWYEQWSKAGAGPNFRVEDPALYIQNFNWVLNWIDKYFFNKVSDFIFGIALLLIILFFSLRSNKIQSIKKKKIKLFVFLIILLLFEWFYNHPALRYGGYCLISAIFFIYFSIFMEKYKISKKIFLKRFTLLIFITFFIFIYRNYLRINYEITTYDYKPLKNFYYRINDKQFKLQNNLNSMITNYDLCLKNNEKCEENYNKTISLKKNYGRYIFFLK